MTNEDKKAECERICGHDVHPAFHRSAPTMCPIQQDFYHNPKLKQTAIQQWEAAHSKFKDVERK